jgi:hypothetical protein
MEDTFFKISLYKNKNNQQKITCKYILNIIKYKIKLQTIKSLYKIKYYSNQFNQQCKNIFLLNNWIKHKIYTRKINIFHHLKLILTKNISI